MKSRSKYASHPQFGIALIEVLIAVLIFSIGLLGLVGLQASMVRASADARYRAQASFVAQQRLGQIWVDQGNMSAYVEAEPGTDIAAESGLPGGRRITLRGDASCGGDLSCFTVRVIWQQPGAVETHNVTTVTRIAGG
ncbi:MAG TPA: type IV pilus modification protein PilV [Noviherbaspirillum sp.]|nr:type IV pilus modification protein PilV [Noviherbaspirillum sp.]